MVFLQQKLRKRLRVRPFIISDTAGLSSQYEYNRVLSLSLMREGRDMVFIPYLGVTLKSVTGEPDHFLQSHTTILLLLR